MKLGLFEIFLLVLAGFVVLFLLLWAREEIMRWWAGRHARRLNREHSNPGHTKR